MELWRQLKVGDRIRLVEIPPDFLQKGYHVHPSTLRVYKQLLARGGSIRIREVDVNGVPWVFCRFKNSGGKWLWHALAFNHGGFVRVKSRTT